MTKKRDSRSTSLVIQLVRSISLWYFAVALLVTAGQLALEYKRTQANIRGELSHLDHSFRSGLAESIWQFNDEQLMSIVNGIMEVPIVLGVRVVDHSGRTMLVEGAVDSLPGEENGSLPFFNELIVHQFSLSYQDVGREGEVIGKVTIFSGSEVIALRLKDAFLIILFNSVIKTLALWVVFFIFLKKYIRQPLLSFTNSIRSVDLKNIDIDSAPESTSSENEIEIMQNSFDKLLFEICQSRNFSQKIVESLGETFLVLNIKGEIMEANSHCLKLLGVSFDAIQQKNFFDMIYQTSGELQMNSESIRDVPLRDIPAVLLDHESREISVSLSSNPICRDDICRGHVISVKDTRDSWLLQELKSTQKQLVESSRKSGMSEVATNILHNVGNVLNSVVTSSYFVKESLKRLRAPVEFMEKFAKKLTEHKAEMISIFGEEQSVMVFKALADRLTKFEGYREKALAEVRSLEDSVDHIKQAPQTRATTRDCPYGGE